MILDLRFLAGFNRHDTYDDREQHDDREYRSEKGTKKGLHSTTSYARGLRSPELPGSGWNPITAINANNELPTRRARIMRLDSI
jgi:hypothetical protein